MCILRDCVYRDRFYTAVLVFRPSRSSQSKIRTLYREGPPRGLLRPLHRQPGRLLHRNGASQGVLREDKPLTNRFLRSYAYVSVESIRRQIENHSTVREHVSTSVDLPLSNEHKRILAYAAEESSGLVRSTLAPNSCLDSCTKRTCLAAELLSELGLRLSAVREKVDRVEHSFVTQTTPKARGLANVTITSMPAGADT